MTPNVSIKGGMGIYGIPNFNHLDSNIRVRRHHIDMEPPVNEINGASQVGSVSFCWTDLIRSVSVFGLNILSRQHFKLLNNRADCSYLIGLLSRRFELRG